MSMILDALARAQRERDQGADARHADLSFQDTESTGVKKQTTFFRIVVAALLLNALVISILLVVKPWNQTQPANDSQLQVSGQDNATLGSPSVQASSGQQHKKDIPTTTTGNIASSSHVTDPKAEVENLSAQMVISKPGTSLVEPPKIVKKPMLSTAPTATSGKSDVVEPATNYRSGQSDYVRLNDLSASEKSAFSRYEINVHVYDQDSAKSFVLINMTRLRNGDRIPGGPLVDRITPEGVILAHNGRKVLIERN